VPALSSEALGYIRHCLRKAVLMAQMMGEEVNVTHHQFLLLMAMEATPQQATDFLRCAAEQLMGHEADMTMTPPS
jgi:hypothetical protein